MEALQELTLPRGNVRNHVWLWSNQREGKVQVLVTQLPQTLWDPMDCGLPSSSVHGVLEARTLEWVAISFSRGSSPPRDRTQVSGLYADSLSAKPQGKLKNTEVGSWSLLQQIFLTKELKLDLLHCRQILYQLRYNETAFNLLTHERIWRFLWWWRNMMGQSCWQVK